MAGTFRVAFAIDGDATKAMAAITKLANAVDKLVSILEKMDTATKKGAQASQRTGEAAGQAGQRVKKTWEEAAASAERYSLVLDRTAKKSAGVGLVNPGGLLPSSAGGGGGSIPPVPPATTASVGGLSGAFQRVSLAVTNATRQVSVFAASVMSKASIALSTFSQRVQNFATSMISFSNWSRNVFMSITDTFRLVAQGLTNIGRSLMFFVALPLGAFFSQLIRGALDFEDALIRVSKTTGLVGEELQQLREELRGIAKYTVSSHVELAEIAEVIGQLGITSKDAIRDLVQIFEMFSVATGMSAAETAESLGKMGNAFKVNLSTNTQWVWQLSNAINALENSTAASAGEIIDATFRFAQAAESMGVSSANATAMGATLVSMGLSADEAGTALKNMSLYIGRNADKVAIAMRSNEKYNTTAKVMAALNEDAVQVFLDIAKAAGEGGLSVEEFVTLMDIANIRGGRALVALANNTGLLEQNMATANAQFKIQSSLVAEYERALSSTKSQMSLLRNNLQDIGITVGDVLLPVLNRVIQILVPAIQMAGEWFKSLDKGRQMMILGIAASLVFLPPLLFFVQQIFHGILLILFGFGSLLKLIPLFLTGFGTLIKTLPVVASFFMSWPGIILLAVTGVLKILSMLGVDIAGFFISIANRAAEWGSKMMTEYSSGIIRAAGAVLKAIAYIIRIIAGFFEAHSPPEKGPLRQIGEWGSSLMRTFLQGFLNADFDILSRVGRLIERILTMGVKQENLPNVLKKVAQARVYLSQLIDIYRQTGEISESVLSQVVSGLGDMAGDVSKLIRLWVEYEGIQQKIRDLEERRKDVQRGYAAEIEAIGASNMSLEDKVKAIRQAKFSRDDEFRTIDKEKDVLEDQAGGLKEQLEYQQSFIDALLDQDDLLSRISDAMDKLAKGAESLSDLGLGLGGGLKDVEGELANVGEMWDGMIQRFEEGRVLFEGILSGFRGEDKDPLVLLGGLSDESTKLYHDLYNVGEKAREIYDTILDWSGAIQGAYTWFRTLFGGSNSETGQKSTGGFWAEANKLALEFSGMPLYHQDEDLFGDSFVDRLLNYIKNDQRGKFDAIGDWISENLTNGAIQEILVNAAYFYWNTFVDAFEKYTLAGRLNKGIDNFLNEIRNSLGVTNTNKGVLYDIGRGIVGLLRMGISSAWVEITTTVSNLISGTGGVLSTIRSFLVDFFTAGFEFIGQMMSGILSRLADLNSALTALILGEGGLVPTISGFIIHFYNAGVSLFRGFLDGMISMWGEISAWFTARFEELPDWLKKIFGIHSPSKVFMGLGENTMLGFWLGMEKVGANLSATLGSLSLSAGVDGVSTFGPNFIPAGMRNIVINIHDPIVRDDGDLNRLSELVAQRIGEQLARKNRYGGHTNW